MPTGRARVLSFTLALTGCALGHYDDFAGPPIENAVSWRLTESGVAAVGSASAWRSVLGDAPLSIEIPTRDDTASVVAYRLCPDGPTATSCTATVDVAAATVVPTPLAPSSVRLHAMLPIALADLPIDYITAGWIPDTLHVAIGADVVCPSVSPARVPYDVDVALEVDREVGAPSHGYTVVRITSNDFAPTTALGEAMHECGVALPWVSSTLHDAALAYLQPRVRDALTHRIERTLCLTTDGGCPSGATGDAYGICRRADGACVGAELGVRRDVALSPWLDEAEPLDVVFAGGGLTARSDPSALPLGSAQVRANGLSLSFQGGAHVAAPSGCVPEIASPPFPTGIPTPPELLTNVPDGWPIGAPAPHVGISLSQRYATWLLAQAYDAGQFCFAAGPTRAAVLTLPGAAFALRGETSATTCGASEPLQITLQPAAPPSLLFGGGTDPGLDPVVWLAFRDALVALTYGTGHTPLLSARYDVTVRLGLDQVGATLEPTLLDVEVVGSPTIVDSPGITGDATTVATAASGLVGAFVAQALGELPAIPFSVGGGGGAIPLEIVPLDEHGWTPSIRRGSAGTDEFLELFGHVAGPATTPVDTSASLASLTLDPAGFVPTTVGPTNAPIAHLVVEVSGAAGPTEISYRVDHGPWRPFVPGPTLDVQDEWLRLQGPHTIAVRARVQGHPSSLDPTPAEVPLAIDADPPCVTLSDLGGGRAALSAWDLVSPPSALEARWQIDGGAPTSWAALPTQIVAGAGATRIDAEVRDEAGHVGAASLVLSRDAGSVDAGPADAGDGAIADGGGGLDAGSAPAATGCGCRAGTRPIAPGGVLAALGATLLGRRRRRRSSISA